VIIASQVTSNYCTALLGFHVHYSKPTYLQIFHVLIVIKLDTYTMETYELRNTDIIGNVVFAAVLHLTALK